MKTTIRARVGLPLFASAAIAFTGCYGAQTDPAGSPASEVTHINAPVAASERPPSAVEARSIDKDAPAVADKRPAAPAHEAVKEVEAPASTKLLAAISEAEAEKLLSSIDRQPAAEAAPDGTVKTDSIGICTACWFSPDLTVVEDDRDQWLWDPSYGWYQGFARGFDVRNVGAGYAGTFHVAVLQGADSYGFDVPGLAPNASQYFQITRPSYLGPICGGNAVIIVNPFNAIPETNYNNNVTTVAGICLL